MGSRRREISGMRAATLCVVAVCLAGACSGMPAHDVEQLGEDADSGYITQYGQKGNQMTAVPHPHRSSDPNFQWKLESANGHAHCAHCHTKCRTQHCHKMCSEKFCDSNYSFKTGHVDYLKASGPVIPAYAAAIKAANRALDRVKDARDDETMETAKELVEKAQVQARVNREHWEMRAKQTDDIDRAAYSGKQAQVDDDKTYILEKATTQQEAALAKADELESAKEAGKNSAFVTATDTVSETGGFAKGTSMLAAVEEANEADDEAVETMSGVKSGATGERMTSVAEVGAEIERAGVKAEAAANAATSSEEGVESA